MHVTAVTRAALADEVAELILLRSVRVRLVIDGPPATRTGELADAVAQRLRSHGRAAVVVDATDYLRPASVRLEFGREDPDELLDRWLDDAALMREVLVPAAPEASGRVLPRLWNVSADRAYRDTYVDLPDDGVLVLHGALLLGRGLPADLTVHLRMGAQALERLLPAWQRAAFARYEAERDPLGADLMVFADHPDRPAIRRS